MENKEIEKKPKKKYNSKKYNDKFREKNHEKLSLKKECEICKNHYTYYSKSKHMKTKKHLKMLSLVKVEEVKEL
jgi:hypothetical protein